MHLCVYDFHHLPEIFHDNVQVITQYIHLLSCSLASFPGLQSPYAVEGLVKLIRRMTSGRRWIDVGYTLGGVALPVSGSAIMYAGLPGRPA